MIERIKTLLADVLFPEGNACHLCGRGLEEDGILCMQCLQALHASRFKPLRSVCGEVHPPIRLCLSAYPHTGEARELVHLLKYAADCAAAQLLGEGIAHAFAASPAAIKQADVVIPVPLHVSRLEERGYNQALLLAREVCGHLGLPLADNVLVRIHATDTQLNRDREARLKAMLHAFAVTDAARIHGKHVLLVDDVLTTGATAMSCARMLMNAGAESVTLLTACRA